MQFFTEEAPPGWCAPSSKAGADVDYQLKTEAGDAMTASKLGLRTRLGVQGHQLHANY